MRIQGPEHGARVSKALIGRRVRGIGAIKVLLSKDCHMSDKSPRNSMTQKSGKSLKEKRLDKKTKAAGSMAADDATAAVAKKKR